MRIILASASPRRQELLSALIDDFEVVPANVPEPLSDDPAADAIALALAKARFIAERSPGTVVIGADTIVFDEHRSFGKPVDEIDAIRMWRALGGRTHQVVTGVAVVTSTAEFTGTSLSVVRLTDLDTVRIAAYVFSGRPLDKAGAYAIQDDDVPTVADFEGCYCSIMGLPLYWLKEALEGAGVSCHDPAVSRPICRGCQSYPTLPNFNYGR